MRTLLISTLFAAISISSAASTLTPRAGWVFVPGAQDLISTGLWSCVSGVILGAQSLTIAATNEPNTVINTSGPVLHVEGDFSVTVQMSASSDSGASLTLLAALGTRKRLAIGIADHHVMGTYWTGDAVNPASQSFSMPDGATDPVTLETARISNQITVFVNGSQVGSFPDPGLFASGTAYLGFDVAPHNKLTVLALAAAMPSGSRTTLVAPYTQVAKRTGSALRDLAEPSSFLIGAAITPAYFSDPRYAQTAGREFNLIVPENAMKFGPTEPAPHQFDFCAADQIVAYAQANGMKVRGHNLVWHQDLPSWLTKGGYSSADAAAILQEHIHTVMGHYKGQLIAWDVVNEAIAYGPPYGPMPSYWRTQLGPNYVDMAFQWAHQADPDVKLFYNDVGGEGLGTKSDTVYNLVKGLISRGVPINGVGFQMHATLKSAPSAADLSQNLARYASLGLEVQITEMDVRLPVDSNGVASAADLAAQATIYQTVLSACRAAHNCTALLTWGITDAHSWIPGVFPGTGAGLLFDAQYQPKPAYDALAGVFPSK